MNFWRINLALRVAVLYALFGGLWILFSDRLLLTMISTPQQLTEIQSYKGWGFVIASAILIYLLLRYELKQRVRAEKQVEKQTNLLTDALARLSVEITERKQSAEALRESEERYRLISMVTFDYMFSTRLAADDQLVLNWVAGAFEKITGYTFEEYIAHGGWRTAVHPDDLTLDDRDLATLRANQPLITEIRTLTKGGQVVWARVYAHPVWDTARQELIGIYGAVQDITERKRAEEQVRANEEQLRNLAKYLQTAREEERARIAREIHDEFGQALTALKIDLSWLTKRLLPEQSALLEKAKTMVELLNATMQTVRRVATDLRPGLLDDLGLLAAIEWQVQEFAERTGLACKLNLGEQPPPFERDLTTAIFRIFQETLTNVARHAEATRVWVEVENKPETWVLTIRDNGQGITRHQMVNPTSLGLMGMRERARAWGGEVTFAGKPGQGTKVTVSIPQPNRQEASK